MHFSASVLFASAAALLSLHFVSAENIWGARFDYMVFEKQPVVINALRKELEALLQKDPPTSNMMSQTLNSIKQPHWMLDSGIKYINNHFATTETPTTDWIGKQIESFHLTDCGIGRTYVSLYLIFSLVQEYLIVHNKKHEDEPLVNFETIFRQDHFSVDNAMCAINDQTFGGETIRTLLRMYNKGLNLPKLQDELQTSVGSVRDDLTDELQTRVVSMRDALAPAFKLFEFKSKQKYVKADKEFLLSVIRKWVSKSNYG